MIDLKKPKTSFGTKLSIFLLELYLFKLASMVKKPSFDDNISSFRKYCLFINGFQLGFCKLLFLIF